MWSRVNTVVNTTVDWSTRIRSIYTHTCRATALISSQLISSELTAVYTPVGCSLYRTYSIATIHRMASCSAQALPQS